MSEEEEFIKNYIGNMRRSSVQEIATQQSIKVAKKVKEYKRKGILPEKYEVGMNCYLDTVEPIIRQEVYEELKRMDGIEFSQSSDALFGVKTIYHAKEAYNKVAREKFGGKRRSFKIDKKQFIGFLLEYLEEYKDSIRKDDDVVNWVTVIINVGNSRHAMKLSDINFMLKSDSYMIKAVEHHQAGRYIEAMKYYDKAIDVEPLDARAWNNKGVLQLELGKYNPAIQCFDKALDIAPRLAKGSTWIKKAEALEKIDQYKKAIECYGKALEINPKQLWVWREIARLFYHLQEYKKAVNYIDKAIELEPLNPILYNDKAAFLISLKKYKEGVENCDKALEMDPTNANAWLNKGMALLYWGKDPFGNSAKYIKLSNNLNPAINLKY